MREAVFFLLYAIVLLFGILLSAAFSGISLDRKQNWVTLFMCIRCPWTAAGSCLSPCG